MYKFFLSVNDINEEDIMKKLFLVFAFLLVLVGCSCDFNMNTPTKKTEEFLMRYKNLDEGVLSDLELSSEASGLTTTEHKDKYIDVMKRQYQDMTYEVTGENIDGDTASVEVKIKVYDLYKARKDAENYIDEHEEEFYADDTTNRDLLKVNKYILDELYKADEYVEYTITINLIKEDNKWVVEDLDTITKEKLHGTYNYEDDDK